jgi:peptide deformylase
LIRKKSSLVTFPLSNDDLLAIKKMQIYIDSTSKKIKNGIAIAAIQIGYDKQIIYIHFNDYKYLIANPKIVSKSFSKSYLKKSEGCLSVDSDIKGIVPRYEFITVNALDLLNDLTGSTTIKIKADGILSICLQHEIDHLNGVLYYDNFTDFIDPK